MPTSTFVPGAASAPRSGGEQLLSDFLWLTADMSDEEAAKIAGVSVPTICRWRRSGARKLREQIRKRLARYVSARQKAARAVRAA